MCEGADWLTSVSIKDLGKKTLEKGFLERNFIIFYFFWSMSCKKFFYSLILFIFKLLSRQQLTILKWMKQSFWYIYNCAELNSRFIVLKHISTKPFSWSISGSLWLFVVLLQQLEFSTVWEFSIKNRCCSMQAIG